ncbi:hypothetical protein HPB52_012731 [Rhipicephalus sanguineus]|uniref:BPTI/Kunitz inhibitor domain-containing protein n=1 Tax=Rhipicephalus sanguineus TaxID=34632 RepID=A0A9D4Q9P9_RHISA|nr:hypothetical protein HPB52_012731 [Rhipicephalus sanguineus]
MRKPPTEVLEDNGHFQSLPLDMGRCVEPMTMYFYDKFARTCKPFSYGGVGGNQNRFYSFGDCMQTCHA